MNALINEDEPDVYANLVHTGACQEVKGGTGLDIALQIQHTGAYFIGIKDEKS